MNLWKKIASLQGKSFIPLKIDEEVEEIPVDPFGEQLCATDPEGAPNPLDLGRKMLPHEPAYCSKAFPNGRYLIGSYGANVSFENDCRRFCANECRTCYHVRTDRSYRRALRIKEGVLTPAVLLGIVAVIGALGIGQDDDSRIDAYIWARCAVISFVLLTIYFGVKKR